MSRISQGPFRAYAQGYGRILLNYKEDISGDMESLPLSFSSIWKQGARRSLSILSQSQGSLRREILMVFVGRRRETKIVLDALEQYVNVIVTGKYGIGRTYLITHIAKTSSDRWRFHFVDFAKTPGKACSQLLREMFPEYADSPVGGKLRYRSARAILSEKEMTDTRAQVIVMDNVASLSPQKIDFIRSLTLSQRFRLIAIVESFLPQSSFDILRARLYPTRVVKIGYLSVGDTKELFRYYSQKN